MPPEIKTPTPNNAEIDKALKEFEMQSGAGQIPSTGQVSTPDPNSDLPKMVRLVIKYSGGAIKDQRTAEYVLLGVVVLFFGASLFFFFK